MLVIEDMKDEGDDKEIVEVEETIGEEKERKEEEAKDYLLKVEDEVGDNIISGSLGDLVKKRRGRKKKVIVEKELD